MSDDKTKLLELTRRKYSEQAIWFLNGFWTEGAEEQAENIWKYTDRFIALDEKKKEGNELDEFFSHKFLESFGETLTVLNLREKLRQIDLDCNGKMSLMEYLMFRYAKKIPEVLNAPQGDPREIEKAQREFRQVQSALDDLQKQLQQQKSAQEEVHRRLTEQKKKLAQQKEAEEEQSLAVKDLKHQEDTFNRTIEELNRKAEHSESLVAKSKAKQELAQLKQENPLPLRKAKITAEAALRKVEKQRKETEAAAIELENAKRDVEAATKRVEKAVAETEEKFREAEAYLEEVKRKGGVANGAIFWMQRELQEAKKYLPQRKQ